MISDLVWLDLLRVYLLKSYQLSPDDISDFINNLYEVIDKCKELLDITQNIDRALKTGNKTDVIKILWLYGIRLNHMEKHTKDAQKIIDKIIKMSENEDNIEKKIESLVKGPLQEHLDKLITIEKPFLSQEDAQT